jgi:uncharacterized membrane protein YqjE
MLKIGEIVNTVKEIVETKVELVKNEIQEDFIAIIFRILLLSVMLSVALLTLLFLSFSLAFFLTQLTNSLHMGFLMVGGFYLIVFVVVYFIKYSDNFQRGVEVGLRKFIFNRRNGTKNDEK